MGYAHMNQRGHGIHLRQFARAFVVDNHGKRVAFVSVDGAMVSHPIKRDVSAEKPVWPQSYFLLFLWLQPT